MTVDTLVIVVYNRFQNVMDWMSILTRIEAKVNVVIIHNDNGGIFPTLTGVTYIKRPNIGFDIGAFQDVCKNRLQGFPEWQRLLWCTDDCFPMYENFLDYFEGNNVKCMKISPYVKQHIRTTGFAISRTQAEKLIFPADPITTKQHCYLFEHRGGKMCFLDQCPDAEQVAPDETSPLWDTGYHRRVDRSAEFTTKWGFVSPDIPSPVETRVVDVICPIYMKFPEIISSMINQTHTNWRLHLVHDGPGPDWLGDLISVVGDDRIFYTETPAHKGGWGHYIRQEKLQEMQGEYVLITNADNMHVPVFLEYMIKGFKGSAIATFCTSMVHSYRAWEVIACRLQRGYVDCAGVLVKTDIAKAVGWNDITTHSADWTYFKDLITNFGVTKFKPVRGCLLIHN